MELPASHIIVEDSGLWNVKRFHLGSSCLLCEIMWCLHEFPDSEDKDIWFLRNVLNYLPEDTAHLPL
jgi:hypothetical protein